MGVPANTNLCTQPECNRTPKARGLCNMHYRRLLDHGDAGAVTRPGRIAPNARICRVPECPREVEAHALCRLHWRRVVKFGSTELPGPRICTECDRRAHARGLCTLHLQRLTRTGTTELPAKPDPQVLFWAKVAKGGPDECWEWQGARHPVGHGRVRIGGGSVYAHRYSLELALGRPLTPGATACHHCDNPPCVNPAHLYEGTQQSNMDDMWRRGRANPGGRRNRGVA